MPLLRYLFALAAVSSGVSAIGKQYDLIDLGTPGPEFYSFVVKTNNTGSLAVTGWRPLNPDDDFDLEPERAFVYRNGTYTTIPNPTAWNGSTAEDINDDDEIVGTFYFFQYDSTAGYVYDATTGITQLMQNLNGLPGSTAYRINNASQILGDVTALRFQAWVYDSATGTNTDVDQATGFWGSFAWDLNENGQLLVSEESGAQDSYYVYTLATDALIPLPDAPWNTSFRRLNSSGMIAGDSTVNGQSSLVIYQDGTFTKVDSPQGSIGPSALNDHGVIVGSYGPLNDRHAYVYKGNAVVDLNTVVPPGKLRGWTLRAATDINNRGEIVGYMTNASGDAHIFRLKPHGKPIR